MSQIHNSVVSSKDLRSSKNDLLDSIVGLHSIETLTSDKLESAPAEQRVIPPPYPPSPAGMTWKKKPKDSMD